MKTVDDPSNPEAKALKFPQTVDEFIALAEKAVEQFWETQSLNDLFGAVLATVHTADWYHQEFGAGKFDDKAKAGFGGTHQGWDALRLLGNGAKHAGKRLRPFTDALASQEGDYEDLDAWHHLGREEPYWTIEHEGQTRSVYALCHDLLEALKEEMANLRAGQSSAPVATA